MKNLLRIVALFVAVVLVASGCSYSEEAEPGVRNLAKSSLEKSSPPTDLVPHLSDDCLSYLSHRSVNWVCLNEFEQQRAAALFNAVNTLVRSDDTLAPTGDWDDGSQTRFLKLLIDFEALEVLCYVPVIKSMRDEGVWPIGVGPPDFDADLMDALRYVGLSMIDYRLSKVHSGDRPHSSEETPVLEPVRYKHLCPSWMPERGWSY